jgi:hypothetical protein
MSVTRLAAIVLVVAGVVAAAATLGMAGDTAAPLKGTIELVAVVAEHHTFTGNSHYPDREAWVFTLASTRAKTKPFGTGSLACSFVSSATSLRQCSGTFSLPSGKIVVAGSFLYPAVFELAVTGGTHTYSSVGGNLLGRRQTDGVFWLNFTLK